MSLIEDAKAAKKAGMTYGQYMMTKPFESYKRPSGRKCANCGGVLYGNQQKYCSAECRDEMKLKTARGDLFV